MAHSFQQKKPSLLAKGSFISLDPNGQSYVSMFQGSSICTDCTVLSVRMGLEFEDGTVAGPDKGVYVHHLYAFDMTKPGVVTSLPCDFETVQKKAFDPMIPFSPFAVQGEDNGD